MSFVQIETTDGVATLTLSRGKVNAMNLEVMEELIAAVEQVRSDDDVRVLILTATGSFFSFGFDVPELLTYSPEKFRLFLERFTACYTQIFALPKAVIAAINGHAVAGGCMFAAVCDERLMVTGRAKIGLNEVTFGASVFAGIVEVLLHTLGGRHAEQVLMQGQLMSAEQALTVGLVDRVCERKALADAAQSRAQAYLTLDQRASTHLKNLLRSPIVRRMRELEPPVIDEFATQWFTESTQQQLKKIVIR